MKSPLSQKSPESRSGPPESEPGQPGRSSDSAPSPTATRLAAFASSRGRYYAVFLAVFCAVLIISNISATKVIGFVPIVTDGGAFLFPISYILGGETSEDYAFDAARKAVITGYGLQILTTVVFCVVHIYPPRTGEVIWEAEAHVLGL